MKAKVYLNISGSQILAKAPPGIKDQVSLRRFDLESELFTLLVFRSQRKDIVLSGAVRHILDELPLGERLVAFGGCFTLEAIALLKERNVEFFAQSEFSWTDNGWQEIRYSIASPRKCSYSVHRIACSTETNCG